MNTVMSNSGPLQWPLTVAPTHYSGLRAEGAKACTENVKRNIRACIITIYLI